jgi:hypothetical protein
MPATATVCEHHCAIAQGRVDCQRAQGRGLQGASKVQAPGLPIISAHAGILGCLAPLGDFRLDKCRKGLGELLTGVAPLSSIPLTTPGSFNAFCTARLSFSRMGLGFLPERKDRSSW